MRKIYVAFAIVLLFSGCNADEAKAVKANSSDKKIWTFVQFHIPLKNEQFKDYYYYGKVSEPLYEGIKSNQITSGFILLDDVKYWGDDDLIHEYADGENEGEIVFRIEDIRKIELVNKKPVAGQGTAQFEEKKKEVVEEKSNQPGGVK
ncbi:MAG: hypothetical protein OEZ16_04185 [Chromatiales bacterium]|nr:hypothetical protein [Chromatiales bacterium]